MFQKFVTVYPRGARSFSACELLITWTSQIDLLTTKIQNIYSLINILRFFHRVPWCSLHTHMSPRCTAQLIMYIFWHAHTPAPKVIYHAIYPQYLRDRLVDHDIIAYGAPLVYPSCVHVEAPRCAIVHPFFTTFTWSVFSCVRWSGNENEHWKDRGITSLQKPMPVRSASNHRTLLQVEMFKYLGVVFWVMERGTKRLTQGLVKTMQFYVRFIAQW